MKKRAANLIWYIISIALLTGCASVSRFQMDRGGSFEAVRQRRTSDCGLVSLIAVMNYWGVDADLRQAKEALGRAPREGYSLSELKQYAEKRDLLAIIIPGTIGMLSHHTSLGRPCIIVYRRNQGTNHSVVVLKVDNSDKGSAVLKVMDPALGIITSLSADWLLSRWEPLGFPILLVAKGES